MNKDKPKTYVFESANKGDITIMNSGEYIDGSVDMAVEISETGDYEEFKEIDEGGVDDVLFWLISKGVEFCSPRSMWFNYFYIADVMISGSWTEAQCLDEAAMQTDEKLERFRAWYYE